MDPRGENLRDVHLSATIIQTRRHTTQDAASFQDLSQHHRAGVACQPVGAALDAHRAVERWDEMTFSLASMGNGGTCEGLVLSRLRPAMPSSRYRPCQRQTVGFDVRARRMISKVP